MPNRYSNEDPDAVAQRKVDDAQFAYMHMFGQRQVLTREEEFALCEQMAAGKEAQAQIDEGHETEQLAATVALGRAARNHLVEANLRLSFSLAKANYVPDYKMDMIDLASGVSEAMIKILDNNFDHTQGNKFSTYATLSLKRQLGRVVAREGRDFALPDDVASHVYRYHGAKGKLEGRFGFEPTDEEYAKEANIPLDKMPLVRMAIERSLTSYDQPVGDDGSPMINIIADTRPSTASVENQVLVNERQRTLEDLLTILDKFEEDIIRRYYGIGTGNETPMTYAEIGEAIGKRREDVGKIAKVAREKMQQYLKEHPEDAEHLRDMAGY